MPNEKQKRKNTHDDLLNRDTNVPRDIILDEYKKDETNISNYPELIMAQDLSKA